MLALDQTFDDARRQIDQRPFVANVLYHRVIEDLSIRPRDALQKAGVCLPARLRVFVEPELHFRAHGVSWRFLELLAPMLNGLFGNTVLGVPRAEGPSAARI